MTGEPRTTSRRVFPHSRQWLVTELGSGATIRAISEKCQMPYTGHSIFRIMRRWRIRRQRVKDVVIASVDGRFHGGSNDT
jgi:hypothetical protein